MALGDHSIDSEKINSDKQFNGESLTAARASICR
jgi:hypothetical protein